MFSDQPVPQASPTVYVRRQTPRASPLLPVFWRFAAARQRAYLKRLAGEPAPWSEDAILREYRFTNPYRASDRVSQALIALVYADPHVTDEDLFLRTLLFKFFNKIETWMHIVGTLGLPRACSFQPASIERVLDNRKLGGAIYSAAYIMPSGGAGVPKHRMHLELIGKMLSDGLPAKIRATKTRSEIYSLLLSYPTLGPFLAFQFSIDLGYTTLVSSEEDDFVVAGPGAIDGISKCFESLGDYSPAETIMWLTRNQLDEFRHFEVEFDDLWGRHLQPIDVQNLFCEVSKYTRVSNPEVRGSAGRTRIKQRFEPHGSLPAPFFPPKWGINEAVSAWWKAQPVAACRPDADLQLRLTATRSVRDTPAAVAPG